MSEVGQAIGLCRLSGWAAGPGNFKKKTRNAGGLAAGDLPGFPKLRGGFSTLSSSDGDRPRKAMACPTGTG